MNAAETVRLFSRQASTYSRFIRTVGYPRGLRAYLRTSSAVRADMRVLDAGCGTGVLTLALHDALRDRGLPPRPSQAFDLTEAMLDRFRAALRERGIEDVELHQADVLELETLPESWRDYDVILSASMLEYLSSDQLAQALRALRERLRPGGTFVLFMTRRNWLTRPLIGLWWKSHLYSPAELERALKDAGFEDVAFGRFPLLFRYLALWGVVAEARRPLV